MDGKKKACGRWWVSRGSKPLEAELVVVLAGSAQTLSKVDALVAGGTNRGHLQKTRKNEQQKRVQSVKQKGKKRKETALKTAIDR